MNTLTQYQYLSNDEISIGIAESIVKTSPVLLWMPFLEVQGNAYKWSLETALANAKFYADGEEWVESTPTWEQRSTGLAILGDDADVSKFAQQTMSNINDIKAEVLALTGKSVAHQFEKTFVYGQTTTTADADEFEGLLKYIAECETSSTTDLDSINNDQVIAAAADSGALTLALIDEMIDAVPGGPDVLMMSRRARRKLNVLSRTASGSPLAWSQEEFGLFIQRYNGIPVVINDFILDNFQDGTSSVLPIASTVYTTTRASGYDNTIIFACKFGLKDLHGIHNGGIQTEPLGTLHKKDATRTRIKWYVAMALESTKAVSCIINCNPDS